MKKLPAIILALLLGTFLVSCNLSELFAPEPEPEPESDPGPAPTIRGDSAVIFAADSAFTIVYPSGDSACEAVSAEIASAVESLEMKKPDSSADSDKKETRCELLVGETSRALSAEAKRILAEAIEAAPTDHHWIWLYRDGQLALYANGEDAYELALEELSEKYLKFGEIRVKTNASDVGYAEYHPDAYMSYEIPDNFFDGYTDPFGMKASEYKKMKLTYTNEETYTVEYSDDIGGTWKTTLIRRAWGSWMMGGLYYVEASGITRTIQTTATDYELVYNCGVKQPNKFRGGNHGTGNDMQLDLTFYDGKSGAKVELELGESITLDGVRIVMHNNIYEIEYTQENVLINQEKSYLYNGYDILVDTKLYIPQDVTFFDGTYSCMLPVLKENSTNMFVYNMDGSVDYVKTLPAGQTSDTMVGGFKATKVEVWGYANPALHMTVEILNPEHQFLACNDEGYLRIRDMGDRFNKIYFSTFNETTTLKHGTELDYKSKWSFSYQSDFVAPDRAPDFVIK